MEIQKKKAGEGGMKCVSVCVLLCGGSGSVTGKVKTHRSCVQFPTFASWLEDGAFT